MSRPSGRGPVRLVSSPARAGPGSRGLDASPEVVERDAVVECGAVNDLAVSELHDPGVAVLIGVTVADDPAAVPDDDDGVAVGVDAADGDGRNGPDAVNRARNGVGTSSMNCCLLRYSCDAA